MPLYLIRFGYTPETWAKLTKNPENRREPVSALLASFGGTVQGFWYSFGDDDGYVLVEVPDNVSAAAVSLAVNASGALRHAATSVLLTVEEMVEAMGRAGEASYKKPGG